MKFHSFAVLWCSFVGPPCCKFNDVASVRNIVATHRQLLNVKFQYADCFDPGSK